LIEYRWVAAAHAWPVVERSGVYAPGPGVKAMALPRGVLLSRLLADENEAERRNGRAKSETGFVCSWAPGPGTSPVPEWVFVGSCVRAEEDEKAACARAACMLALIVCEVWP